MVDSYDKIHETFLDYWMDYLKTVKFNENAKAPGLQQVKKKLQHLSMTPSERRACEANMDNIMVQNDAPDTAYKEGWSECHAECRGQGLAESRTEGFRQGILNIALNIISLGMTDDVIILAIGRCLGATLPAKQINHNVSITPLCKPYKVICTMAQ